jgi:5-methylcytosine-specific restriction endonuclease McrA
MVSHVFVVDSERKPLNPVHPGRARRLLTDRKAAVLRRFPFTIILKGAVPDAQTDPLRVKIDPGSKTTGLAMVNDVSGDVVWAAELSHRGQQIVQNLDNRRMYRRSRRQRHTRYRQPRFHKRRRSAGWLPPSRASRIRNVVTWVQRLQRYAPIAALSQELTKFDTQALQDPEISGVEYQQGTLAGYELREYLLEKWERRCAYCRRADLPLHVEHIVSKARGGSNRVSNLTLACESCNQQKGHTDGRGVWLPGSSQADTEAPERRRGAQCHTVGALSALTDSKLTHGNWDRREDDMESHATGDPQNPLVRCRLCGIQHASDPALATGRSPADRCNWLAATADVFDGCLWLPAHQS